MCEINAAFENEIIEKVTLEDYIKQFDPEIQNILYNTYGSSLEAMLQNMPQTNLSPDRFLERLLKMDNVRNQRIILMRFGFVTGSAMTLQEVAEALDIPRERVRQVESMFLRRAGSHARRKKIIDYYKDTQGGNYDGSYRRHDH